MRVEAGLQDLEASQYAGEGQEMKGVAALCAAARKIEELGFDSACMPEAGQDPFLPLALAAEHTRHITLATNVAIAFPRSPLVTAQIAWDLQRFSGGRFQLGLGTQVKGHNERRYAAPWTGAPGPRLREYILCLRAMFDTFQNGREPKFFRGDHYQFTMMPPFFNPGPIEHPNVPIYVAAVNRYMVRLGGELCDGLRLHPIATFKYTRDVVLPGIEAGARKAGRNPADVDVVGAPFLAVGRNDEEVEAAKRDAKQRIAFYASTRTYHAVLEYHGWKDLGMQLHQHSLEGKWREMADLITDDVLEEFTVIGTEDDFVARLKERCAGVFTTITLDLPRRLRSDPDQLGDVIKALHAS